MNIGEDHGEVDDRMNPAASKPAKRSFSVPNKAGDNWHTGVKLKSVNENLLLSVERD